MKNSASIVVRPVEREDAADLRENCFSMNMLEEVKERVERTLQMFEEGSGVRFVAEVADVVVRGDYQRRGIARRLIAQCRAHAESMGVEILEIGVRGGTPAEEVYRRLGFIEYARLPRGIKEPWGDCSAFDEVLFYQPLERAE
jgi:GNAT superfamily N-acetyltransferase